MSALDVSRLGRSAAAEGIASEWAALWKRTPSATTFQHPQWILTWMHAFQPRAPLIVEVRKDGRLVAIAPLLIYEDGAQRVLGLMGGGVSDYLDVLVEQGGSSHALLSILDYAGRAEFSWDTLHFTDLSAASPLLELGRYAPPFPSGGCTQLPLPPRAECLREVIPRHKYENLKNARSRWLRSGAAKIERAVPETLGEFLDALFRLHESRWTSVGQPGVLGDERIQAFHRRAAPALLRRGTLRFYGVRFEGQLIAALYSFFERTAARCYLQAFDPAYSSLSAGSVLLGTAIGDAMREGKQCVDFLRGQEAYKYSWGVQNTPTFAIKDFRTVPTLSP